MYSRKAKKLRQCKARCKNGKLCQAWAVWGEKFCKSHRCKPNTSIMINPYLVKIQRKPKHKAVCHCKAYNWPHRPGSGICNWPDPPNQVCTTPEGTHSKGYNRKEKHTPTPHSTSACTSGRKGWEFI